VNTESTGSNVYYGGVGGSIDSCGGGGRMLDVRLLRGAALCAELRAAVLRETGFTCSAGIRSAALQMNARVIYRGTMVSSGTPDAYRIHA
jgi:hypothetical protein